MQAFILSCKATFKMCIRDRLKAMAPYCGFPEDDCDKVFITLDKMDKIGLDGVAAELLELGYAAESVEKYKALLDSVKTDADGVRALGETLKGVLKEGTAEGLAEIMETVSSIAEVKFGIEFDPTLVLSLIHI